LTEHCDTLNALLEVEFKEDFLQSDNENRSDFYNYKGRVIAKDNALTTYFNNIVEAL